MGQQLSISESEWRVMKIVWSNSPQTLPEILDKLKETGWSKTTIQTYLARLVKKRSIDYKTSRKGIFILSSSIRK
ncbi:MAG: BlaI/MecI/CopY family transcriptional regulator [Acutalibacteraceae bacterium]